MAEWYTHYDEALRELHPVMTQDALAEHFGVSRSTVDKRCRVLGLRKGPRRKQVDREEILERIMLDQSLRQISRELGIHREVVTREARMIGPNFTWYMKRRGRFPEKRK